MNCENCENLCRLIQCVGLETKQYDPMESYSSAKRVQHEPF